MSIREAVPLLLAVAVVWAAGGRAACLAQSLPAPSGTVVEREFRLEGAALERLKTAEPALKGVTSFIVTLYRSTARNTSGQQDDTRVLEHYRSLLSAKGWPELYSGPGSFRRAASFASADGKQLLAVNLGRDGFVVTRVGGAVRLSQLPAVRRALIRALKAQQSSGQKSAGHGWYLGSGRAHGALQDLSGLRASAAAAPRSYSAHMCLGRALYESGGSHEEALKHLQTAASLDPGRGEPHYYEGRIYEDAGRTADALAAYGRAAERAPHWVSVPLRAGAILERQGDRAGAQAQYRKALRLHPDCKTAKDGLARTAPVAKTGAP